MPDIRPPALFSKATARDFFHALRVASKAILKHLGIPVSPGRRTRRWEHGHPVGITYHYTAGVSWKGAASWLNDVRNTESSCHLLVADRLPTELASLFPSEALGLDVLVIMLADLDKATWHGNWSNGYNVGIENRNAGILRRNQAVSHGARGTWTWWANEWRAAFPHVELGKTPELVDGTWWEPYTVGQLKANVRLGQMLYGLVEGALEPSWLVPHSCIKSTKFDTGRLFPLQAVRQATLDQISVDQLTWLKDFQQDPPGYMDAFDEAEDLRFLIELAQRQAGRRDEDGMASYPICEEPPGVDLQLLIQKGAWRDELDAVRRGLSMLGYVVDGAGPVLDKTTAHAVWMFQKCAGFTVDSIPGDETQRALAARLAQFGLRREA